MAREEGWHHETFVPDPVYRVRDFFNSWEITSNELKSPPGRIALCQSGIMSLEQPAAGGESCKAGFFLDGTHFL